MQASTTVLAASATPCAVELAEHLHELWGHVLARGRAGATYAIFEELELTLTQVKAMCALSDQELTVKQIAERLGLSLPGASRAADALVARGLLSRREDRDDRRMKRLSCTDAGRRALAQLEQARLAGLEAFAATLPEAQCKRLSGALAALLADLRQDA